jgi:transcriptional regulator with XRE-family HTH domain
VPARRRRATAARARGQARARYLGSRFGTALREARQRVDLTQGEAADRAGISQPSWSRLERGFAAVATIETIATAAAAVGMELAAFIQDAPGADLPRDIEHIRRQELVGKLACRGNWQPMPERGIDPMASRSRSIDVYLERPERREAAVVEIVDLIDDVGAVYRGLADKVAAVAREHPGWATAGLLLVRATRRNRDLVAELDTTFSARFPARSRDWLKAIQHPDAPMPQTDGLAWTSVRGDRLIVRGR